MLNLKTRRFGRILLGLFIGLGIIGGGLYAALGLYPKLGAQTADGLRAVVGDEAVAKLEAVIYDAKDQLDQQRYELGLKKDESPWVEPTEVPATPIASSTATALLPSPSPAIPPTGVPTSGPVIAPPDTPPTRPAPYVPQPVAIQPREVATLPPPARPALYVPQALTPFTKKEGEGQWQTYLKGRDGTPIGFRTFLAPDPKRPYATVGIVAIDLNSADLRFVLGTQEPVSNARLTRTGKVEDATLNAGQVLAAFNSGFKTQHGNYGVMFNQSVLVPARDGFMTLGQLSDGSLRMGRWDREFERQPLRWWRQNGPPIINAGVINPLTDDNAAQNWGAALDGSTAVWRSALGLSPDGRVLYYAAGDSMVIASMARALKTAGVYNAMQLDINNYWVHFSRVQMKEGKPIAEPLFDAWKAQDANRFLQPWSRDFFYVAAR